jgi:hypothetical protein
MLKKISMLSLILILAGCDYFDEYDKYNKINQESYKIVSIDDDFDANSKSDAQYYYTYNTKGFTTKIEYDYQLNGVTNLIYNYSYSEDKLSKASVDYNADGKDDLVYNYKYLDNRLQKVEYDYNNDSKVDYTYSYNYNTKGLVASYKVEVSQKGITIISDFKDDNFNKSKYFCDFGLCLDFIKFPNNSPETLVKIPHTTTATTSTYSKPFEKGDIEYKYSYNDSGLTKSISIDYNIDGTVDTVYNYYYNDKNLVSKIGYDYDANGVEDYLIIYNYNSDNLVSKLAVDYYNDSTIDIEYIYEYNSKKLLNKLSVNYASSNKIDTVYSYNYNDKNLLISIDEDYNNDSKIDRSIKYNYMLFKEGAVKL